MVKWDRIELTDYPCDLCGTNDFVPVLQKRGRLVQRTFRIVRCTRCGHVWVSPRIADARIPDLYDQDYYEARGFDTTVNYRCASQSDYRNSSIVDAIARTLRQLFPRTPHPRTLDVGCGFGDLVLGLRDRGFDATGYDSSPIAHRVIAERGVPHVDEVESAPDNYAGAFDLVTAVEVIEHVTSPRAFLSQLRRLVHPGGFIFILTGNWLVQRLVAGTPYIMPEGHIHYFTPKTLAMFFRASGLDCTQVPLNAAWYVNRALPPRVPARLRIGFQRLVRAIAPDYGPLPIAMRRPSN